MASQADRLNLPARKKLVVPALPISPGAARTKHSLLTSKVTAKAQVNGGTKEQLLPLVAAQDESQLGVETEHDTVSNSVGTIPSTDVNGKFAGNASKNQGFTKLQSTGAALEITSTTAKVPNGLPLSKPMDSAQDAGVSMNGAMTPMVGWTPQSESVRKATDGEHPVKMATSPVEDRPRQVDGVSPLSQHEDGLTELMAHPTPSVSSTDITSPTYPSQNSQTATSQHHASKVSEISTANTNGFHVSEEPAYPGPNLVAYTTAPFPTIQDYLLHLANAKQYGADWAIQIEQPSGSSPPSTFYAHGLLLYRSERLRSVMSSSHDPNYLPQINLYPARAIQPHAFDAALRFFYTDTVLGIGAFPKNSFRDKQSRTHIVDYILSYWAAGVELGIGPVAMRAFDLLTDTADWDVAELLVREAADLRRVSLQRRVSNVQPESLFVASSIIGIVSKLFCSRIDLSDFRLDTTSQPTLLRGRFAAFETNRASDNPVLASIAFGSMPSSASLSPSTPTCIDAVPTPTETTASVILLNLDFEDLVTLARDLVRAHGENGTRVIVEAVAEREKRRAAMAQGTSVSGKLRTNNPSKWDVSGVREFFMDGKLQRERVGSKGAPKA